MTGLPNSRIGRSSEAGFTLIEAMVVLLLLSSAMVGFSYFTSPSRTGSKVSAMSLELATVLRSARSEAIAGNREVAFVFDAAAKRFYLEPGEVMRRIPAEMGFTVTAARLRGNSDTLSSIVFFGDGSSTGGTIDLSIADRADRIEVNWLTGAVHVRGQ